VADTAASRLEAEEPAVEGAEFGLMTAQADEHLGSTPSFWLDRIWFRHMTRLLVICSGHRRWPQAEEEELEGKMATLQAGLAVVAAAAAVD
jgi:hypothetical protein